MLSRPFRLLFVPTCSNCTQLLRRYGPFTLRPERRVSTAAATVQRAVFLGHLDISLLAWSLRFCTFPHTAPKKVNKSHCSGCATAV